MTAQHISGPRPPVDRDSFHLPQVEESCTGNGLRILIARRDALPLATLRLTIRAGSACDPPGKEGLAHFVAEVLRRGTRRWTADQIDEAIEFYGGHLSTDVAEDHLSIVLTAPSKHLDAMLKVMGEMVQHPSFPEREVASARTRTLGELFNDRDDPAVIANRAVSRSIWGNHPYGHTPVGTARQVRTFSRQDVLRFHQQQFAPGQALLVIVGADLPSAVVAMVERTFGPWKQQGLLVPSVPSLENPAGAGQVLVIDKPDQTQSQVRIGSLGFRRAQLERFAAEVMNAVLGGVFFSRLMQAIRVDRGLSYGARSRFESMMAGGTFTVFTFTKTETTREIIDVALEEISKLRKAGITQAELEAARTYLSGLYPLQLETEEYLAEAIAEMHLYQLGQDWVDLYRSRLRSVTMEQAAAAARKYLEPSGFTYAVVGEAAPLRQSLKSLGPMRVMKISQW